MTKDCWGGWGEGEGEDGALKGHCPILWCDKNNQGEREGLKGTFSLECKINDQRLLRGVGVGGGSFKGTLSLPLV